MSCIYLYVSTLKINKHNFISCHSDVCKVNLRTRGAFGTLSLSRNTTKERVLLPPSLQLMKLQGQISQQFIYFPTAALKTMINCLMAYPLLLMRTYSSENSNKENTHTLYELCHT